MGRLGWVRWVGGKGEAYVVVIMMGTPDPEEVVNCIDRNGMGRGGGCVAYMLDLRDWLIWGILLCE